MRHAALFALSFALFACRNDEPRRQRAAARPSPTATRDAAPAPAREVADASASAATTSATYDAGSAEPAVIRSFRVGESVCVRDASRATLGASATGFFSRTGLELEVRNVAYTCAPGPTYEIALDGETVVVRYRPAPRAALTRCTCRHDQFLQVTGVPRGDYDLRVEEALTGDAGARVVATGRVAGTAR